MYRSPSTLTGNPSDASWGVVERLVRVPRE
jgi:hypothetical protein